jgi:Leucine-rich repeat (LRR) protein
VYWSSSNLVSIPEELMLFTGLEVLDLSFNKIVQLSGLLLAKISSNLKRLDLKCNSLTWIPNEIHSMKKLEYLNVFKNELDCLPDVFDELQMLSYVDFSNNLLKEIPSSLYCCINLSEIQASNNQISSLEIPVGSLMFLKTVKIDISF